MAPSCGSGDVPPGSYNSDFIIPSYQPLASSSQTRFLNFALFYSAAHRVCIGVETRALTLSERSAQPAGVGDYAGPSLDRQHFALRSDRRADFAKDKVDSLCVVDVEKFVH